MTNPLNGFWAEMHKDSILGTDNHGKLMAEGYKACAGSVLAKMIGRQLVPYSTAHCANFGGLE